MTQGRLEKLLLTGAAGGLGRVLRDSLKPCARTMRVSDIAAMDAARDGEEVVPCDLADKAAVDALVKGCDAIVHLGGVSVERPFEDILEANIKGVFIFRFEDPAALPEAMRAGAPLTAEGKVPVIYRIDMSNPATFFVMQSFPMRDKDILYVSNAPAVDFQKFVGLVSQLTFSIVGIASQVP